MSSDSDDPADRSSADDLLALTPAARRGLWLFAVYVALYAGFMLLTVFNPHLMATTIGGVNIAIIYGLGLILAAIILALIYMLICRATPR